MRLEGDVSRWPQGKRFSVAAQRRGTVLWGASPVVRVMQQIISQLLWGSGRSPGLGHAREMGESRGGLQA